jgi:hypothetical protein
MREKIGQFAWIGKPLEVFSEIMQKMNLFKPVYGLVDYSNTGISFVDQLKAKAIKCDGVMYRHTDPESKKNMKITMFEYFQDHIDELRYPILETNINGIRKIVCSEAMYNGFMEWTVFERHGDDKGSVVLTGPKGSRDDIPNSDCLAVFSMKKIQNTFQSEGDPDFYFSGYSGSTR